MKRLFTFLSALLVFAGFASADDPKPAPPKSPKAAETKPAELLVGGYTFKAGAPWQAKQEPRPMSSGGFSIPGKDGSAGVDADFYHFGSGQGGDVESNVKRWQGQFQTGDDGKQAEPVREELTLGGKKITVIHLKGTFLAGPAFAAKKTAMPGYAMTGAIIPGDDGSVFVKIVGPDAALTAAKEDVKKLISSPFPAAAPK